MRGWGARRGSLDPQAATHNEQVTTGISWKLPRIRVGCPFLHGWPVNLLLIDPRELSGDRITLRDRRAVHLRRVLRVTVGRTIRAGLIRGPRLVLRVTAVADAAVELVVEDRDTQPAVAPDVDVILAVPRPKVLARTLELSAAMGVRRIDLINAWRVDKSYLGSRRLAAESLREALVRGCEQGATTWLPDIAVHKLLMPWLASADFGHSNWRVIAHPRTATAIEQVPGPPGHAVIAIGPEGGWIDREVASFADCGFVPATLGMGVLRVEAALTSAIAQCRLLKRLS